MADVAVTLRNGKISVDKNKVQASVSRGEKVKWQSNDGPFSIFWKNQPGTVPPAKQNNGVWETEAGPFNNPGRTVQYGIEATGYSTLDPEIDIIP